MRPRGSSPHLIRPPSRRGLSVRSLPPSVRVPGRVPVVVSVRCVLPGCGPSRGLLLIRRAHGRASFGPQAYAPPGRPGGRPFAVLWAVARVPVGFPAVREDSIIQTNINVKENIFRLNILRHKKIPPATGRAARASCRWKKRKARRRHSDKGRGRPALTRRNERVFSTQRQTAGVGTRRATLGMIAYRDRKDTGDVRGRGSVGDGAGGHHARGTRGPGSGTWTAHDAGNTGGVRAR